MSDAFQAYCSKNFKVDKDQPFNYHFMPGNGVDKGIRLMVPEDRQMEFWSKYHDLKIKPGICSSLLERPLPEFNPLKIDLDIKLPPTPEDLRNITISHKYTIDMVKEVIIQYLATAAEFFQIPLDTRVTIFEKKTAKIKTVNDKNWIKDGVHIMCPDIVAPNVLLLAIYYKFIQSEGAKAIHEKFGTEDDIENLVDKCVIDTNAWFPVGSGKPEDNLDYYKPTHTFKVISRNGKVMLKPEPLNMSPLDTIIYFSNSEKSITIEPHASVNVDQLAHSMQMAGTSKATPRLTAIDRLRLSSNIPSADKIRKPVDMEYVGNLMKCLNKSRVDSYEHWIKIGICLYNISPYLYGMWNLWSAKSEKYDEDSCYIKWYEEFTKNGDKYTLGIDQLRQYAKIDNEAKYKDFMTLHRTVFLEKLIKKFNGDMYKNKVGVVEFTETVQEYIELHCEWQVVCADQASNTWYKFEGQQWVLDKAANKLHLLFQTELYKTIKSRYDLYSEEIEKMQAEARDSAVNADFSARNRNYEDQEHLRRLLSEEDEVSQSMEILKGASQNLDTKIKELKNNQNIIKNILTFIDKPANRSNLVKDLAQILYDREFYTNLDINPAVYVCKNCVLDLDDLRVRQGLPKDMMTMNCGLDFPTDTNSEQAQNIIIDIEEFLNKIFPIDDVQEYVLNLIAECLGGIVRREEFFIHTGVGKNGKSMFSYLLSRVFGEYYYAPDSTIFNTPKADPNAPNPVIANARGKHFIITSEPKQEKGLQSDIIKHYSGGSDPLTGRHLNHEPITFIPMCKWNMMCNDIPDMDSTDGGIWRRIRVIPYVAKFVEAESHKLQNPGKFPYHYPMDSGLKGKIDNWAPYFLYMLWNRYQNLKRTNFRALEEDNIPAAVMEATEAYKRESNVYEEFYSSKMEEKPGYRQTFTEVYAEFKRYYDENDFSKKLSRKQFATQMSRFFGKPKKIGREEYIIDHIIIGCGESTD